MWGFTREKIEGVIRALMTFGGGYLVAKGVVDEATVQTVIGAVVTLMGAFWSVMSKQAAE